MEDTKQIEEKILIAARKVFITKGFESTQMKDIAEYSGINRGLLEYYYRNKQCLFDSVFEKAFLSFIPSVVEILLSSETFRHKIDIIIDGYFRIIDENPYFADFFFNEVKRNPKRLVKNLRTKGLRFDKIDDMIRREVEKGNIKYIKAEHLICNILSLVMMPFTIGPLLKTLLSIGEEEFKEIFIEERKQQIKDMIYESVKIQST